MTQEQVDTIWKLAMQIQFKAYEFGNGEDKDTLEYLLKGQALMKAKSNLYKYLKENLDDTTNL